MAVNFWFFYNVFVFANLGNNSVAYAYFFREIVKCGVHYFRQISDKYDMLIAL